MRITSLKATGIELTDAIKNYAEEKLAVLEKFLHEVGTPHNLFVELAKITEHHKSGPIFYAEADIVIPGSHLRAEATAESLYAAIDKLHDEIKGQLKKLHDKKRAKARKAEKELE
ncbi:MAG: ribosome-associated translation inhibitor RaiA [bacterium]